MNIINMFYFKYKRHLLNLKRLFLLYWFEIFIFSFLYYGKIKPVKGVFKDYKSITYDKSIIIKIDFINYNKILILKITLK